MTDTDCTVSIIMPCYNAEATLPATLDSVMSQSFQEFFITAVNDGSSDGTVQILEDYAERFPDKFKIISQQNQGQTVAKNAGIRQSKSELVAFLDSDDLWAPDKLAKQVGLLNDRPEVGLCYTAAALIDEHDQKTGGVSVSADLQGRCYENLIRGNNIVASSVLVRRAALEQAGCYDESFRACENWELWIRIARDWQLAAVDEPLTSYRVHQNNMTRNVDKMLSARLRVIDKHLPAGSSQAALRQQRKEALFKTRLAFAKSHIEDLRLAEARCELVKALKMKPAAGECHQLYLKTLLGSRFFQWVRDRRGQAE